MRRLGGITLAALLGAASAFAQPVPKLSETVNVHLVEVPVTALDRAGNPIRGLTKENFELFDAGKRRDITTFDTVDFTSGNGAKAISPLNPYARRGFLLLFDLSFSSPLSRQKAQDAAALFVARDLDRRDLAAVATVDIEHGFRLLTAFTTDRTLLGQAVANPQTFVTADPLQIASSEAIRVNDTPGMLPSTNAHDVDAAQQMADWGKLQTRMNDTYNRTRIERQLTMLGGIARALRNIPGRKQVVLFSEGFDAQLVSGRENRIGTANDDQMQEMEETTAGNYWRVDFDKRFGSSTSQSLLQQMAKYFRGSDVVLHAVDIRGVRVQNDLQSGTALNSNEGLYLLSHATGGEVFKNSNDLSGDLDKLLHQQEVVYVLGFNAPSTQPGRYHDLRVTLKNVPSGSHASSRAGYYESGNENALERTLTNAEVVLNDIPQDDIKIATLAAAFPSKSNSQVPVIVEINGRDLQREAKNDVVNLELFVYAFDEDGVVRDRIFERMKIDTKKTAAQLERTGIKYYGTLLLPTGKYAIKSLVRIPATEHKGFARNDLVVPGAGDVVLLPPLFIEKPGEWVMVRGVSHDPDGGYPFVINGEPFIPSAAPTVRNGEAREFALFVANAQASEVTWDAAVTEAGATRVAPTLVRELQGGDTAKLLFRYAPQNLAAGIAQLDVSVRRKGSPDARSVTTRLHVTQ